MISILIALTQLPLLVSQVPAQTDSSIISIITTVETVDIIRKGLHSPDGQRLPGLSEEFVDDFLRKNSFISMGPAGMANCYAGGNLPQLQRILENIELLEAISKMKPGQLILANSSDEARQIANRLGETLQLVPSDGNPGFMNVASLTFEADDGSGSADLELGKPSSKPASSTDLINTSVARPEKTDILFDHPFVTKWHPKYANPSQLQQKWKPFSTSLALLHLKIFNGLAGSVSMAPESLLNRRLTDRYSEFLNEKTKECEALLEAFLLKNIADIDPLRHGVEANRQYKFGELSPAVQRDLRHNLFSSASRFKNVAEEDAYLSKFSGSFRQVAYIQFAIDSGDKQRSGILLPLYSSVRANGN